MTLALRRSGDGPCLYTACSGRSRLRYRLREFDVVQCDVCRTLYRQPLPDQTELAEMYADTGYLDSTYFQGQRRGADTAQRPEIQMYDEGLDWLEGAVPDAGASPRRILDVGCGTGRFLSMAAERGWEVAGVEMSREHCARARDDFGIDLTCGDFADAPLEPASFDAITMWDLLEHVVDPIATLEKARRLLAPGGRLLVFTINSASFFNWVAHLAYVGTRGRLRRPIELLYDRRHNFYFTAETLSRLLQDAGFSVEQRLEYRAHLGRWLSEPAAKWMLAGAEVVDLLSVPLRMQYRQSVLCAPTPLPKTEIP